MARDGFYGPRLAAALTQDASRRYSERQNAPIKRGTRFLHAHFFDPSSMPNGAPLICVVTAVRSGTVYYRPDYGKHDDGTPWLGSPSYFALEDFWTHAREIVQ